METLYLLIPVSIVLVFLIIAILWWAVKNGQFEDMEGPGAAIIMDDDSLPAQATEAPSAPIVPSNQKMTK